jgi:low temperature requirement protein LtrA
VTESGAGWGVLRGREQGRPITFVELFFDLVYVLAITQLTHLLAERLSILGAVQTLLLLLAIWWAWVDTAWVTNWFDPDRPRVRVMLVGIMILSLIMSATLPQAFVDRGGWFAGAYAAMQVGRSAFAVAALGGEPRLRRNFQRILSWKVLAGTLWVAGAIGHGSARLALWAVAVTVEYFAAAAGFYTPGLGRSTPSDWTISGPHLAERSQLFILIALGESILVTGSVFASRSPGTVNLVSLVVAFLGSVALWWIYFDRSAEAATAVIGGAGDPGRLGRSAYTYHHLPMVAGIIVAAVGDELIISHASGHSSGATIATVLGGPALFLAGHALFKRAVFGGISIPRLVAIAALVVLVPAGLVVPPVALAAAATLVVAAVAAWDVRSAARSRG